MQCAKCKHWQGHKHSEWADCYRVVAALEPNLKACYVSNDWGTVERYWDVPFDPHDVKYWAHNEFFVKLYNGTMTHEGVREIKEVRDDIIYDAKNGERTGRLKLRYFQTHKDYECREEI